MAYLRTTFLPNKTFLSGPNKVHCQNRALHLKFFVPWKFVTLVFGLVWCKVEIFFLLIKKRMLCWRTLECLEELELWQAWLKSTKNRTLLWQCNNVGFNQICPKCHFTWQVKIVQQRKKKCWSQNLKACAYVIFNAQLLTKQISSNASL